MLHNGRVILRLALTLVSLSAFAQVSYLPLSEIRPKQKGTGYTVFSGEKVEPFDVEILGVLVNAGPRQSIILAKLSGGPLAHTGVLQGMSGSPVYVGGRLIGAVALAFSFSKDPIAGIRPIEEMLAPKAVDRPVQRADARCLMELCSESLQASARPQYAMGETKLVEIATPVSFSGLTQNTLDQFAPRLRAMGLEPRQGISGGGSPQSATPAAPLKPGSMISVQLISGDVTAGADGTVTHIDGKRIYAFGHRFVSMGEVEMPFAASEVITLLPNLGTSFKISTARNVLGSITNDYSTAVQGELGRKAKMIPVTISVKGGTRLSNYSMQMVEDSALTPYLLQMAIFSALDSTERTLGSVAFSVKQSIEFENRPPVISANIFSGEFNAAMMAAQNGAIPISFAMQAGFRDLRIRAIRMELEAFVGRRHWVIEDAYSPRRTVKAGETIPITVVFSNEGNRILRTVSYRVPDGAPPGQINFSVNDGPATNVTELRSLIFTPPKTSAQVVKLLAALRNNVNAYVRVWRAETAYLSQGEDIPDPPPSVAQIYARSQGAAALLNQNSKLAELVVPVGNALVTGSKTVTVEVKE